ncbi:hypothetical protein [Mycobacterium sp. MMS18-G62]
MRTIVKNAAAGAVLGGSLLAAAGLGLAHAAPPAQSVVGDGKINVTVTADGQQIGTLQDVSLASAETLASSACPTADITAQALQALDANGTPVPGTCAGVEGGLTFAFAQNGPGNSENAPGQTQSSTTATTPSSSTSAAPTTTAAR